MRTAAFLLFFIFAVGTCVLIGADVVGEDDGFPQEIAASVREAQRLSTAFYHLGFGKALVPDHLLKDWKSHYFEVGVWLDDQIPERGRNDA